MVKVAGLIIRFRREVHAQAAEHAHIDLREDNAGMHFAVAEFRQLL
jgi:hypothetical protein